MGGAQLRKLPPAWAPPSPQAGGESKAPETLLRSTLRLVHFWSRSEPGPLVAVGAKFAAFPLYSGTRELALAIEPGWVGNGNACKFPAKTGGRRRAGVGAR